ncbi:MAG: glycosidase [Caulobacteraceae bacterium]|nr:glycosidase [Caulobacteraceae bacterium]
MPKPHHLPIRLDSDPTRVVIRPFYTAPEGGFTPPQRARALRIIESVRSMDMRTVQSELALVNRDFEGRHWQTRNIYLQRYKQVMDDLGMDLRLQGDRQQLVGAFFCHEYSYAAAALMNPSVVPHPDQSGLTEGSVRFVLSLRAVGEGHISSVVFREGILDGEGRLTLMPQPPFATATNGGNYHTTVEGMPAVTTHRHTESGLSGTVIFPITPAQRNGLEDLRLVHFTEDDGSKIYLGTYTAYSGSAIASEMMRTQDFHTFSLESLSGSAARNKGMALFPRKVDGQYLMIGRQDGENIFIIRSDRLHHWDEGELLMTPQYPWELVQIGNCGSPLELDEGWLLLTHGVGAMRKYSIGAVLLDKHHPEKIIGRLTSPLISPADEDREGYVPNVVYTCGAMVHGRTLFMPYGVADSSVAFCLIDLDEILAEMI